MNRFGEPDPSRNGIYTIRSSDGGGLTRLTNAEGSGDIPLDYSPDSTQIVFGRFDVPNRPASANSALFVVDVDGRGMRRITLVGRLETIRGAGPPTGPHPLLP